MKGIPLTLDREAILRDSHTKLREFWMQRREKESLPLSYIQVARRASEDRIIQGWIDTGSISGACQVPTLPVVTGSETCAADRSQAVDSEVA